MPDQAAIAIARVDPRLPEAAGLARCGPFGNYSPGDPLSVFMEKSL